MKRENIERAIDDGSSGLDPPAIDEGLRVDAPRRGAGVEITPVDFEEMLQAQLEAEARGESVIGAAFAYIDEVRAHPDYEPNWVELMMEERR
jgi:hypothetical protein